MCDWEEFIFGCSCSYTKRKNYCHFARNDPNHQCFGVQVLKKVWDVPEICDKCSQRNNRTSSRSYQPYGQDPSKLNWRQTQGHFAMAGLTAMGVMGLKMKGE